MRELALFAGAGGGILGGTLLGFRTVCAVEIDAYRRSILLSRQRDGVLPRFPIWSAVETFDGRPWRGSVEIVTGGFPCTPFSSATRGRKVKKSLWPEMLRIVEEVEPQWVLIENVYQALPYLRQVVTPDLEGIGYLVTEPLCLPAAAVGAPFIGERLWMVAQAHREGQPAPRLNDEVAQLPEAQKIVWWENKPTSLGVADGVAHRMDRLSAAGDGQLPAMVALAWEILTETS